MDYFLDFLGLKGAYPEKDLETAILRDSEQFLVELGSDFALLARQTNTHFLTARPLTKRWWRKKTGRKASDNSSWMLCSSR
jgi:predicted nuclease of restriction endonuclease-like (RecB) superfamily